MIDFSIPLAGLNEASSNLDKTAANIAKAGSSEGDSVELSKEMVELLRQRREFQANATVIRTEDDTSKNFLDLVG